MEQLDILVLKVSKALQVQTAKWVKMEIQEKKV